MNIHTMKTVASRISLVLGAAALIGGTSFGLGACEKKTTKAKETTTRTTETPEGTQTTTETHEKKVETDKK